MFCFQELPGKFEYDNSLHVSTAFVQWITSYCRVWCANWSVWDAFGNRKFPQIHDPQDFLDGYPIYVGSVSYQQYLRVYRVLTCLYHLIESLALFLLVVPSKCLYLIQKPSAIVEYFGCITRGGVIPSILVDTRVKPSAFGWSQDIWLIVLGSLLVSLVIY